ncbi:MAG: phage portal protein [Burkholderiales bacterium]|nr:phage portal protein [Burkholderiales bacterium]
MFEKLTAKVKQVFNAYATTGSNTSYGQNSGTGYGGSGGGGAASSATTALWDSFSTSADSDLIVNRDTLVQRSRGLFMSTPLATGAIKSIASGVVGGGLTLSANINYEYLGIDREVARELEKKIEFEFGLWANDADCCDSTGTLNFEQMQQLAMLSVLLSGDVFILMPIIERKNSIYDLKLKFLEADRVQNPRSRDLHKNILAGIEIDDTTGRPSHYHIVNQLPYAVNYATVKPTEWARVPVFGEKSGRRNILHLFTVERPEQRRGIPLLSPVINTFKQLSRYTEAEIMGAIVRTMFAAFIQTDDPTGELLEEIKAQGYKDSPLYKMAPGMVMTLKPGEKMVTATPGGANQSFDVFIGSILKQIAVAIEIPPEVMMKNFTSSYSASRASILAAYEMYKTRRKWLINKFCEPVYREWLSEAVAKGRIAMPGFFDDTAIKAAWCGANFFGNSLMQIDPIKEVEAAEKRVQAGFSTRAKEASELTGLNYDELVKIRAAEEKHQDTFRRTEKPVYTGTVESSAAVVAVKQKK